MITPSHNSDVEIVLATLEGVLYQPCPEPDAGTQGPETWVIFFQLSIRNTTIDTIWVIILKAPVMGKNSLGLRNRSF